MRETLQFRGPQPHSDLVSAKHGVNISTSDGKILLSMSAACGDRCGEGEVGQVLALR